MSRVALSSIPTLRQLYSSGFLELPNPVQPRYASNDSLLDCISLVQGDITELEVDVIVNAANKSLLGGGGVDGAIHRAAGRGLLAECRTLNGCETGDAKITKGYNLPSKHVIHTVGPVYSTKSLDRNAAQLASCYTRCLGLATENSLKSIAFPSISTGVYGYPIKDATYIALSETRRFMDSANGSKFDRIVFTVFSDVDREVYEAMIPYFFPLPSPEE